MLRSSPAPEGRCCWSAPVTVVTSPGRCDPHRPRRAGAAWRPDGPLPSTRRCCDPHQPRRAGAARAPWTVLARRVDLVAILTGPGGPVLPSLHGACMYDVPGCDPHRPRRAGAAGRLVVGPVAARTLRSSPTPEGRCCPTLDGSAVALIGSTLRSSPAPEGRCCCPIVRGVHRVAGCDPHRPRRAARAGRSLVPRLRAGRGCRSPHGHRSTSVVKVMPLGRSSLAMVRW